MIVTPHFFHLIIPLSLHNTLCQLAHSGNMDQWAERVQCPPREWFTSPALHTVSAVTVSYFYHTPKWDMRELNQMFLYIIFQYLKYIMLCST